MQMTIQIILLGLVLMVLGLLLKNWKPPIKEQYIFIILAIVGGILGYFMLEGLQGVLWGFVGSGLVFYKDELVKEATAVKDSFDDINGLKHKTNNEIKNKQEDKGE